MVRADFVQHIGVACCMSYDESGPECATMGRRFSPQSFCREALAMSNSSLQREPLHVQLRDLYAAKIARGELRPGDRLPTNREMMGLHHVASGTAAKAVGLLAAEQLVETGRGGTVVRGRGAVVLGPRLILGPQQRLGLMSIPPGERTVVNAAATVDAPAYVAAILDLEPVRTGDNLTLVFRREQIAYDPDGVPMRLEVSWFDSRWTGPVPDLASGIVPVPSLGGVAWMIAEAAGEPITEGGAGIESREARDDGREVPLLGLAGDRPQVLAVAYTWLAGGRPVEYGEFVAPPDRVIEFRYAVGGGR
jgi:DNA-binding GntR family transcriptional regulator